MRIKKFQENFKRVSGTKIRTFFFKFSGLPKKSFASYCQPIINFAKLSLKRSLPGRAIIKIILGAVFNPLSALSGNKQFD
jgi:hypothetical protein